ncbi:chromosome segregation protein SMC [Jeotgalibaca sp. MA1X17-3]|nr:chromosome segregation protein SMC [Jeotgalibaca sp. MA1X17-3]
MKDFEKQEKQLSEDKNKWIQQLREVYIEKLQLQSTNKNTLLHLNKERERIDERTNLIKTRALSLKEKTVECTLEIETKTTQIEEYEKNIKELEIKTKNNKEQLEDLQKQQNLLEQKIRTITRDLQQAEARKESQQELEDRYANYYQGVKEILKRRETIKGVRGPIGELLQVSEELSVAMDTALGSAIQHIVVSDPSSASNCISILKNHRLGRATFLPLSVIKGKSMPASILKDLEMVSGFIGMANTLVTYEEPYEKIASHLLGTTIISRDLQSGISISKMVQNRYRIVSLEGDVIHAGGSMTGGATKKQQNSSVFSRKNTIQKLANEIDKQSKVYKELKSEFDSKERVIHQFENQIDQGQTKWKEYLFQLEKMNDSKDRELEKLNLLKEEKVSSEYEEKILIKNLSEVEKQIAAEKELKNTISNEIIKIKTDMETSTMSEEERINRLYTIQKELQNAQQKLAVLLEREKQIRIDIQNSKNIIETEQRAVDSIQNELEENKKEESSQIQTRNEITQSFNIQNQKKREINQSLKTMRNDKKELERSVESNRKQLQELTYSLKNTWTEIAKLESRSGRYEVAIDHHLNRLSEEYGLSFELARKEYRLSLTTEEASATVHRLKDEIQHLGIVNLASIEEFERISKRYEFLTEQQNDLITAKEILLNTMNEMDQEVSTRFEKKFYEIKNQFEITFPKLFGGGKATIQLTDPTNILETGIEITAQPPGKRLQQLSLLSGGEKAFTAIALLFSIIEVSSVPFCILDEVEAALDEANVTRFGKYVSSFEGKTQFIIITHRKGTMQEADVLYGVTMQDSGVSRLASVRFDDKENV